MDFAVIERLNMNKWMKNTVWAMGFVALTAGASVAQAAPADDVIYGMSNQILKDLRTNAGLKSGNKAAVSNYVDANIMPKVNFRRWVASAVGPAWNKATPAQQEELMQVMRRYFVSTYSSKLVNNTVTAIDVYPAKGAEVKTIVKHNTGASETVIYYMEDQGGWRAYDVAINGVKVSNTYRGQFKNAVNKGGVPALITDLQAKTR